VTATGVAHKVSFSPAPLDFGSGLLVMREQCNKMGTCGLGTEKVGLPIEKALTVKNEGTVSVSLTLSTAAPYKIVSVLPTLSPGQSAQVTLRFDPSESGTFTGTVQVGINGGQGSVTAPLVGTAHKIEVSPPQIGFGLLLLSDSSEPTYKEQQLTVKNQGVTTVSVTASVSEPFRITTGNSFALAPAASSEVTVRFDPPAPGEFQGAVKLTVGQLTIEIPAKASAMNEQDFLQMLAELSQIQELDTVIPTMGNVDIALLGFKNVSASELKALLELAKNGGSVRPEQTGNPIVDLILGYLIDQVLSLFNSPASKFNIADVITALRTLADTAPQDFEGNYKSFSSQSSFGQFVNVLSSTLSRLPSQILQVAFNATDAKDAAKNIIESVVTLYREYKEPGSDVSEMQGKIITIITNFGPAGALLLGGLKLANLSITDPATGKQVQLVEKVINDLRDIISNVGGKPWYDPKGSKLWVQIAQAITILGLVKAYAGNPGAQQQFAQTLNALLITANMARDNGWDIYGFRVTVCLPDGDCSRGSGLGTTVVDVIAATTLSTGKQVNIFAQFYHAVTGYNEANLQNLIDYVIRYALHSSSGRRNDLMHVFGLDPTSALRIAGYTPGIVVAVNTADVNDAKAKITDGRSRCGDCFFGIVIEIDPDKEEVIRIIGIGISDDEAKEIAARMGITVGSKWSLEQLIMYLMGMFMK